MSQAPMRLIFTRYVRALGEGGEPETEDFEALWRKLGDALRSEMVRRSLWSAPPGHLGIYGATSWHAHEAFEELLHDCYFFIFARRLAGLLSFLEARPNIEGLVFRNIRHFLFEKQKQYDPLGYRVFGVLQRAIERALAAGTLHRLDDGGKIGGSTLLAFAPDDDPTSTDPSDRDAQDDPDAMDALVARWVPPLLPDLVTSRGRRLEAVVETLAEHLPLIAELGVRRFHLETVAAPFKRLVRASWQSCWNTGEGEWVFEDDDDELVRLVRLVRPDSGFEERQSFRQILHCVAEAIDRVRARRQTRLYLERLWVFLRNHAAETAPGGDSSISVLPSRRRIAELLDIPRYRFPELHATLGSLVEGCRMPGSDTTP